MEPPTSNFAFPLDSEMWRVNHQKCGLFFGSAAAILQIAHPRIAQGVADHSNFSSDSLGRLTRTLAATNRIAFGTLDEALAVKAKLQQVHNGVNGQISEGMDGKPKYSAFEPDLLLWVLATMIEAARRGYELVYGPLTDQRFEQFYREMRQFGTFFGLKESYGPADTPAFEQYYQSMLESDLLGSHPLCAELTAAIIRPQDSPAATALGNTIRFLPVETLPSPVRERLGLKSTPTTRASMSLLRRTARLTFPRLPAKIKCYPEALERLRLEKQVFA